jgi:hypothetical protein
MKRIYWGDYWGVFEEILGELLKIIAPYLGYWKYWGL